MKVFSLLWPTIYLLSSDYVKRIKLSLWPEENEVIFSRILEQPYNKHPRKLSKVVSSKQRKKIMRKMFEILLPSVFRSLFTVLRSSVYKKKQYSHIWSENETLRWIKTVGRSFNQHENMPFNDGVNYFYVDVPKTDRSRRKFKLMIHALHFAYNLASRSAMKHANVFIADIQRSGSSLMIRLWLVRRFQRELVFFCSRCRRVRSAATLPSVVEGALSCSSIRCQSRTWTVIRRRVCVCLLCLIAA